MKHIILEVQTEDNVGLLEVSSDVPLLMLNYDGLDAIKHYLLDIVSTIDDRMNRIENTTK